MILISEIQLIEEAYTGRSWRVRNRRVGGVVLDRECVVTGSDGWLQVFGGWEIVGSTRARGVSEETGARAFGLGHSAHTRQVPLHTIRVVVHLRLA